MRPLQIENPYLLKDMRGSMHGETIIQYDFTTDEVVWGLIFTYKEELGKD